MRIAFVLGEFPTLSETFILNQITGLFDRGHTIDIYATRPRDDPKYHADIDRYGLIDRTFYMKPSLPERLRAFAERSRAEPMEVWKTVRRRLRPSAPRAFFAGKAPLRSEPSRRYDIVHCHFGLSALTALARRRAGGLAGKLVTTFYGYDLTSHLVRHGEQVYAELFRRGDRFLAICDYFKSRLIEIGCPAERIQKHPIGIDPGAFPFVPRSLSGGEPVRIVTIARLVEKKGVEYALRAFTHLRTSTAIEYTIIGDGPLRADLETLAREVNPSVTVRFAGWLHQAEVAATLERAHLLIAPSATSADGDQEGTPTAILEAMAAGLPVVSTWHSGIPELVQDGVSGRLVPERDAASLSVAIEELVRTPEMWIPIGRAGRARVEERHNIHKLNDELVRIYEGIVAHSARTSQSALTSA